MLGPVYLMKADALQTKGAELYSADKQWHNKARQRDHNSFVSSVNGMARKLSRVVGVEEAT